MWRICKQNQRLNLKLVRYFADEHGAQNPASVAASTTTLFHSESAQQQKVSANVAVNEPSIESIIKNAVKSTQELEELKKPASFDDVPGPAALRYLSKITNYISVIIFRNQIKTSTLQYVLSAGKRFGNQLSWVNNLSLFRYLLNEFGPVVRLHGLLGGDVVILSRPEHATVVFDNDGPYPIRSSIDCVEKYRLEHRLYKQAGPFVMHGPQWEALRKAIEPALASTINKQHERISSTSDDFVERLSVILNKQQEVPRTFIEEIQKWCMQCLCEIMFNKKINFLDARGLSSTSEAAILLEALNEATTALKKCEFSFLHLWKFFETPSWKKLCQNCDTIDHILSNYLRKAQDNLRERKESLNFNDNSDLSMVDYFLIKDSMLSEDILTVLLDMMLLGVNMTSHSAGFLLYYLARNPRSQQLLYNEISKLPENFTKNDVKKMMYLKACLHESLRLKPPMPVLSRVLSKDITVHGYNIPKNTPVLIAINLSCLREENFEDPLKFKPERWSGIELNKDMEALATIPFGHGPKACLAKDLAENQICTLIIKILRKYKVEYHYGDIESNNKLLAAPSRPFRFRFALRN